MNIEVKGPIIDNDDQRVYDWFDIESTSPKKIQEQLEEAKDNEDIEVEINSGGGSVFAGSEIYTTLKSYKGNITVKIVGLAASAASVIAMAGNKILISPTAQLMIHNVSGRFGGDYKSMEKGAEILKNANATISNAYKLKTGLTNEELLEMMNNETWLTPQQALDNKFVDEIMFTGKEELIASISNGMLPPEVIEKMKNRLIEDKNNEKIENGKDKLMIELDLI